MKNNFRVVLVMLVISLLIPQAGFAQFSADNQTNIVDGVASDWAGYYGYYVGQSTAFGQLQIINGGALSNGYGFVGYDALATNNSVLVSGTDSVWSNRYDLSIGEDGSGNALFILGGGRVVNGLGVVGNAPPGCSNTVTVSSQDSVWSNAGDLIVGRQGIGNQLTITNGGWVENTTGYIGFNSSGQNNRVLVTGNSSVWTNRADLYVGYGGEGNQLLLDSGGRVENGVGYVGFYDSGSNNSVLVTGSGSLWRNRSDLYIGSSGGHNQLAITSSGRVESAEAYIGWNTTSRGNQVLVSGTGSVWNSSATVRVGHFGAGNQLSITDGGLIESLEAVIGYHTSASNNVVSVNEYGSWQNSGTLTVGYSAAANHMEIFEGGQVACQNGVIGTSVSASNNSVAVSGQDSAWINRQNLYVGFEAPNSQLTISNGGVVTVGNYAYLGRDATSTGNQILVAGGSLFVTNATSTASLDVRRGTLQLDSGTLNVDNLTAYTSADSVVQVNGGTLITHGTTIANGSPFTIGNGTERATLHLNYGQHTFADGLLIASNAVLSGNGVINSPVSVAAGATVAPGDSAGTLYIASLTLDVGAILDFELADPDGTSDSIIVNGALTLDGLLNVSALPGFTNGTYTLMTYTGSLVDNGLELGALPEGYDASIVTGSGRVDLVVIPEPSSLVLAALALGWLVAARFVPHASSRTKAMPR